MELGGPSVERWRWNEEKPWHLSSQARLQPPLHPTQSRNWGRHVRGPWELGVHVSIWRLGDRLQSGERIDSSDQWEGVFPDPRGCQCPGQGVTTKRALWRPFQLRLWASGVCVSLRAWILIVSCPYPTAGISGKSQILFALVFTTRYLDLFTNFISIYNTVMKVRGMGSHGGGPAEHPQMVRQFMLGDSGWGTSQT